MMPDDEALLTHWELDTLPEPYRTYVANRRNDTNVNIATYRPFWDCFMLLDAIWTRELADLTSKRVSSEGLLYTYGLFGIAYAKMHVIIDLCFSDHVEEAYSILRSAIESVVHGCRLLDKPELLKVWRERDVDEASLQIWKEHFWFGKETRLFEGLPELYAGWKLCSDLSHANVSSVHRRFYESAADDEVPHAVHFIGVAPREMPLMLGGILQALTNLEGRMFERTKSHLKLDAELLEMRAKLRRDNWAAFQGIPELPEYFAAIGLSGPDGYVAPTLAR